MRKPPMRSALIIGVTMIGLSALTQPAKAAFTINALVGGAPTGVSYANFDDLPLGSAGGTSGGIAVSFIPDGQTVVGASDGFYAAPFLSNSNGTLFGDPSVSGADTTRYLTTGLGSVSLLFPALEQYVGLLWGSVDDFNNLAFYSGADLIGTVNGLDVQASASGDQGIMGTFYVNIASTMAFDRIVATSTSYAFEFDNVAYNPSIPNTGVPEPFTIGLLGIGLFGMGAIRQRKKA